MNKPLDRFANEVLEVMPLMFREFARREDNALAQGKISCPQMVALTMAAERSEVTVGEIARTLSSEKSSVSVLLDRLVKQGLMKRRHDERDRRLVWIRLTPKGRKVIEQIHVQKRASLKAIFGPVPARQRAQYLAVLRKVKANLMKGWTAALLLLFLSCADANAFSLPWSKGKEKAPADAKTAATAQRTLGLQEAYRRALERSESVAITAEEIAQAQARFYRSFDYFLPNVHFEMNRFQQDVDDDSSSGSNLNFGRQRTPEKKFVFSQPLFSGFKEIAALQGSGADKKAQRMKYKRAKELLFVDVMEAYYTVLNTEKDTEVLYAIHKLMSERFKELRERVDLGRSRESELKTSLTDMKILESDLVDVERDARIARNLLEFYLGESLEFYDLAEGNAEGQEMEAGAGSVQERSDVLSSEQEYIVAQKKVISANANFFPTISLDGNYYTQRVGFQSGNDWDVTLKFDVPVFEVGQTLGDVKEAASNREKARLTWEQAKRLATLDVQNAREELVSSQRSKEALGDANRASKENYEILQKEYGSNLVNNLEVLDALRRYQDIEKRYQEANYTAKKNYWKLRLALGEIPVVEGE